ncbi:MAG: CbtB domain-containing protein [Dongiaceae bacterium]
MLKSLLLAKNRNAEAAERAAAVVPALLAVILGVAILWGVGLAGPSLLHNAAHDTRHAQVFPCH